MVKDIETMVETSVEDLYTRNRKQLFQYLIRETHPAANRINAERTLARQDDDFYSTHFKEYEKYLKQTMLEMPNPCLWRTDAFYFRLRYLLAPLQYNWAKVPIGAAQEKLFNEWASANGNYIIYTSDAFAKIKADKARNPKAKTWADFYREFDPDVPETRNLQWYHRYFDYGRRHKWDERCMRMKRWVQSGTIDSKHAFFDIIIVEWKQYINRPERFRAPNSTERRYATLRDAAHGATLPRPEPTRGRGARPPDARGASRKGGGRPVLFIGRRDSERDRRGGFQRLSLQGSGSD